MGFPKEGPLKYKQNIGYHCHSLNQVQSHNSIPAPIVKHNSRPFPARIQEQAISTSTVYISAAAIKF